MERDTRFKKGQKSGPGRPKGLQNKVTRELKDMILAALDESGGVDYLKEQAKANPTAFLSLVGKVLPMTVSGDANNPIVTIHEVRRTIVKPGA